MVDAASKPYKVNYVIVNNFKLDCLLGPSKLLFNGHLGS